MIKEKYLKNFHVTHDKFNKYFVAYIILHPCSLHSLQRSLEWSHNGPRRDDLAFLVGPNSSVVVIVGLVSYYYHMRPLFIMYGVI